MKTNGKKKKLSIPMIVLYVILAVISFVSIIPFIHVVACTFAPAEDLAKGGFLLVPSRITFDALKYIFSANTFVTAMTTSIYITIVGTFCSMVATTVFAYPLAHKHIMGRKAIMFILVLTMVFNPGMIPSYLNIRDLGLLDSTWALILPTLIVTYNFILVKNFFQLMPDELRESAKIDGANDFYIFAKIILPLSKPVLATISLFYAVAYWNSYLPAILYINDSTKWPIQVLLRNIVIESQVDIGAESEFVTAVSMMSLKSAVIFVATVPILCVYPFAQKYFVKGLMLGSVKG